MGVVYEIILRFVITSEARDLFSLNPPQTSHRIEEECIDHFAFVRRVLYTRVSNP